MERSISPRAAVRCNFSSIYVLLLFIHDPLSFPISLKISLPSSLSLSLLSLVQLFQRSPRRVPSTNAREIGTREVEARGSGGGKGKSWTFASRGGALFNKTGQRNIDDSIPGRAVGRSLGWVFSRAFRRTNRVSTANRIESNRKEPRRH